MSDAALPEVINLLAHDLRWQIVQSLAQNDHQVNELVEQSGQPLNLVSYHLRKLREGHLLTTRRSEADGRDIYYSLDLEQLRRAYLAAGAMLHPGLVASDDDSAPAPATASVLFVCTHNSARSQIAEGLMRHLSQGQVDVHSAGSEPRQVHPDAIQAMAALGIDISRQKAKHFDAVIGQPFDTVITVCDRVREICPTFPGKGRNLHWGYADPLAIDDPSLRQQALTETARQLQSRIEFFLSRLKAEPAN